MVAGATRSSAVLDDFAPPVPAAVAARVEAFAHGGLAVEPRRSASVVLLRDPDERSRGPEVYLLHRHARMPFAPSVAVFPGGGVDPVDLVDLVDDSAGARSPGGDPVRACAIRETAEETTVRLEPEALVPWARWVTPEVEPRRHDTTFFLARLPEGQVALDVSGETVDAGWTSAREALVAREAGALALMPPTWSLLLEVAAAPDVATLLDAGRDRQVETVLPRVVRVGAGWRFAYAVVG